MCLLVGRRREVVEEEGRAVLVLGSEGKREVVSVFDK